MRTEDFSIKPLGLIRMFLVGAAAFLSVSLLPAGTEIGVARAGPATDTLSVAMPRGIRVLDGFIATSRQNLVVQHLIDDGLLYVDPETLSYKPLATKAYRYVNPRTLEFDIRDGVTFHDGSPLTADDVVYTFEFALNPANQAHIGNRLRRWLKSVQKTGPMQVRLFLRKPFAMALRDIAVSIPIRKKDTYRDPATGFVERGRHSSNPIGLGPYKVARFARGQRVTMVRYDGYYATSPKPRGGIDRIVVRRIRQLNACVSALKSGRVDWVTNLTLIEAQSLENDPNYENLTHVLTAAEDARNIVAEILAFSRHDNASEMTKNRAQRSEFTCRRNRILTNRSKPG